MPDTSTRLHRFSHEVILHVGRLDFRFTMSLGAVEELMAERGLDVS